MLEILENEITNFKNNNALLKHSVYSLTSYTTRILVVLNCYAKIYYLLSSSSLFLYKNNYLIYFEKNITFLLQFWLIILFDWCKIQNQNEKNNLLDTTFFLKF